MTNWLDDLSEDWISQPASSSSPLRSQAADTERPVSGESPSQTSSQSYNSFKTSLCRESGSQRRRSALTERSASQDNVRLPSIPEKELGKGTRRGLTRRSFSAESTESALFGSVIVHAQVERKSVSVSPPKSRKAGDTPEWRRRLLKGEMGYGDQKDLFSPRGIENIFQKPPPPRKESFKEGSRGLSFLKSLESLPSSPPPWPSEPDASNGSPTKSAMGTMRGLEAVDEEEEEVLDYHAPSDPQVSEDVTQSENKTRTSECGELEEQNELSEPMPQPLTSRDLPNEREPSNSTLSSIVVSGQSEQYSDDFSPVFISKHNTADGHIAYAPLDLSRSQLANCLQQLRESQQSQQKKISEQSQQPSEHDDPSLARLQFENLPEDLPVGTPEIASIGDFVNVRRGGFSADGSFLRRPLSPSPLARPLSASVRDSTDLSRQDQSENNAPVKYPSSTHVQTQGTQRQSSLREVTVVRHPSGLSQAETDSQSQKSQETAIRTAPHERVSFTQKLVFQNAGDLEETQEHPSRQISQFGSGDFDQRSFPDDFSSLSLKQDDSEDLATRSPSPSVLQPGSQHPFKFHIESPPVDMIDTFRGKRKLSKPSAKSTLSVHKRSTERGDKDSVQHKMSLNGRSVTIALNADGKRPPTSPFKDSTPKRRRTLVLANTPETTKHNAQFTIHETHRRVQSAVSKKRKNARYDSQSNVADPEVLAQRHILRPRNPTPSQRRRQEIEAELYDAAEHFMKSSPRLSAIKEHLNPAISTKDPSEAERATLVATEVAAFNTKKMPSGMKDHERKRSVTTQDFLDEATKIMNFIRNKGKSTSDLENLMESELETRTHEIGQKDEEGEDLTPASPLSISRPPTREGFKSGWRSQQPKELDARVMNHLKKYQDADDDGFMASSLRLSRFSTEVDRIASHVNTLESHPPGIQIIDQKLHHQKRPEQRDSDVTNDEQASHRTDTSERPSTQSSQTTADSSLGRTTASRKSENVATLAPEAVAHLIPQQIAGMTFDQIKGIWVKSKSPRKDEKATQEASKLSQSEDDPFNDIPDLTVDELQETQNLLGPLPFASLAHANVSMGTSQDFLDLRRETQLRPKSPLPPSQTLDDTPHGGQVDSLNPSRNKFGAQVNPNGMDTVEGESPLSNGLDEEKSCHELYQDGQDTRNEEVDHEYSIHEGRNIPKHHQVSELKVSISSPVIRVKSTKSAKTRNVHYEGSNGVMNCHENHQNNRIHDRTVSVAVTGVVVPPSQSDALADVPPDPFPTDVTFYMSELPEFTLNQIDERDVPARPIVKRAARALVQGKEDRFAWGNFLLVKALQDVEPHTDWEDLRHVDLHGKNITSLHLLDVLCERLEKLDISSNEICQLSGASPMTRSLNAERNLLTSLTSWSHLINLQYLNVSENNIENLRGFGCLIHLRELKADNNQIESLDGIQHLDALLKLSVKGNRISSADFTNFEL
jgi:hypothetical protein